MSRTAKRLGKSQKPMPATTAEKFASPLDVHDADVAFGGGRKIDSLMPPMADIPGGFSMYGGDSNPFVKFQREWFFRGFKTWPFKAKPGIDATKAIRHLATIQGSFAPPHEYKVAAVAYLMSLWFEEPE